MAKSPIDIALSSPVAREVLAELPIQDTVHDFWDGGRGEANPIDEGSLLKFRNDIELLTKELTGKDIPTITLQEVTKRAGSWINKPSNYERSLILKYENKYPSHFYSKTKETITYKQILADFNDPRQPLKTKYLNNRGFCNVVSIIPDPNEYFDSFTTQQKNIIANFILTFMFAKPENTDVGKGPYGITYDAGPVAPRKVFADIEQMYNYIYPQNITDSAATSFKSKKIQFIFPRDSVVKSNVFTRRNGLKMEFLNRGYGALNRYAFNWLFTMPIPGKPEKPVQIQIPFGPGQSDGPSVNYLVTSFIGTGPQSGVREKATIADISPLQPIFNQNRGIIFDLKRSGDFEQVHASMNDPEAIFATIDHLCSFYARLLHKPCIWSNNASSEIVMYRFDTGEVDPIENAKREVVFFAQENVNRLKLLSTTQKISEDLQRARTEFQRGTTAFYVTLSKASNLPTAISFIVNPSGYVPDTTDKQGYIADALTTAFLRAKCLDTLNFLNKLVERIMAFAPSKTPAEYEQFVTLFGDISANPLAIVPTQDAAGNMTGLSYKGVPNIQPIIQTFKTELSALDEVLDLQLTNDTFYKPLIEGNNTFNHKASNPMFEFSAGHLKGIHTAFRALLGLTFSGRAGRDRDKKAFGFLTEYFSAREVLLGTFRDEALAEKLRTSTDIQVADLLVSEASVPILGQRAVQMVQSIMAPVQGGRRGQKTRRSKGSARTPTKQVTPFRPAVTSRKKWKNPVLRPELEEEVPVSLIGQTTDLSLSFRDICGKAAAFVESCISEEFARNGVAPADGLDAPLTQQQIYNVIMANPSSGEILRDISLYWETELLRIRENALDNYGVAYSPGQSEAFLSMLLSMDVIDGIPEFFPYLPDTPVLPREMPEYQDFFLALLTTDAFIPRNLIVLTIFDNILNSKYKNMKYFKHLTPAEDTMYDAPTEWQRLSRHLTTVTNIVNSYTPPSRDVKDLWVGGRRNLYSPLHKNVL